jgi:uncharacterized protein (TIGR03437 family)
VMVPATVTVRQGKTSASFNATSLPSASGAAVVTAIFGGSSSAASFAISSSSAVAGTLSCPAALTSGTPGRCRITLRNVQGDTTAELQLASSSGAVRLPASVRTRAGQSTVEFQIDAVDPGEGITVTAGLGPEALQATLSVTTDKPIRVPGRQFARLGSELRFRASTADPAAILSAGNLPVGAEFDAASGEFRWTPAGTQPGSYTLSFSAVDSAGRSSAASVPVEVESGDPVAMRVVNAASHSPEAACSAGAIATIEGRWLTDGSTAADASGGSSELAGTKVWANGAAISILSASSTELKVLCPNSVPGSEIQFVVESAHGAASPLTTTVRDATPGIFSLDGTGAGQSMTLLNDTGGLAMVRNHQVAGQPAVSGDQVLVYATGIGRLANIMVQVGDVQVAPAAIDAVPSQPGLWRIAITVPDLAGKEGDLPLSLAGDTADGARSRSNVVTVALEPIDR